MATWHFSGYTTISLHTVVEADSFDDALEQAQGRGLCSPVHNAFRGDEREEWMAGELADEATPTYASGEEEDHEIPDPQDEQAAELNSLRAQLEVRARQVRELVEVLLATIPGPSQPKAARVWECASLEKWIQKGADHINDGDICVDAAGRRLHRGRDWHEAQYPVTVWRLVYEPAQGEADPVLGAPQSSPKG